MLRACWHHPYIGSLYIESLITVLSQLHVYELPVGDGTTVVVPGER